jgi:hypothetical protein
MLAGKCRDFCGDQARFEVRSIGVPKKLQDFLGLICVLTIICVTFAIAVL